MTLLCMPPRQSSSEIATERFNNNRKAFIASLPVVRIGCVGEVLAPELRHDRPGLWFWQLGYVPAASERLHQEHAGVHATAEDIDLVALVREGHGLGGDDLQVVVDPAPVAVREELERLL